jgi:hypothetical protein
VKYMLLMRGNGTSPDGEAAARVCAAGWPAFAEEMRQRGVGLLGGGALEATGHSATVQVSGQQVLVADGPFAETKEQVGGYQLIECASRDDALYAAARHPLARSGVLVEVRPLAHTLTGG